MVRALWRRLDGARSMEGSALSQSCNIDSAVGHDLAGSTGDRPGHRGMTEHIARKPVDPAQHLAGSALDDEIADPEAAVAVIARRKHQPFLRARRTPAKRRGALIGRPEEHRNGMPDDEVDL